MLSEIFSMLTQGTNVIYHHVNRQSQVSIKSPMIYDDDSDDDYGNDDNCDDNNDDCDDDYGNDDNCDANNDD